VEGVEQFAETLVHQRHQQTVQIAEVVLDDAPGHTGAIGDVPDAGWGEALVENAAHRLIDDDCTGAFGPGLTAGGRPTRCGHEIGVTTARPAHGRWAADRARRGCRSEPGTRRR